MTDHADTIRHDPLCAVHGFTGQCSCGADPESFFHVKEAPVTDHADTIRTEEFWTTEATAESKLEQAIDALRKACEALDSAARFTDDLSMAEDLRRARTRAAAALEPRRAAVTDHADTIRRVPPELECRGGCGRRRRTWTSSWLCRFCLLAERAAFPESFRSTRRRLSGRCVVCGGPWPDGSGCEHCPKLPA